MKKHIVLWAAVLAALVLIAVILGIAAFSPPDKGDEIIIEPQPAATPEVVAQQTAEPTVSPTPIPTPTLTPSEEAEETYEPAKKPSALSQSKSSAAFTLKIKDRTISVAHGVDEVTLDKTPGWLTTSASPGEDGMCVVYGHMNRTHLRVLEKVECGDAITATMPDGTVYTYTVSDIQIYENTADLRLPLTEGKTICLVTCYPFRYSGSAPGKCVVLGVGN